jgi:hypothetical protein
MKNVILFKLFIRYNGNYDASDDKWKYRGRF